MDGIPQWSPPDKQEGPSGGPLREATAFVLRHGIPIVLTIVVTTLAANFFLRMRAGSADAPQGSSVFAPPESEPPSQPGTLPGRAAVSSLDFAPSMGEPQAPPEAKKEEAPPSAAAPAPPPELPPIPAAPASPRPKGRLVTGSFAEQNQRTSSGGLSSGFSSLRDQQAEAAKGKEAAKEEAVPAGALGGGAQKGKKDGKDGRQMKAVVMPSDPGLMDLETVKQQAYKLEQIGRELIQQSQDLAAPSAIRPTAPTRALDEGKGPHQGRR